MIALTGDRAFPGVEDLLSVASKRQQAMASNVANLDTPGYHAKDYTFASALASLATVTTSDKHISTIQENSSARVIDVGTADKPNGNNVDIERELTEITKNGLQYVTLVQYLNQKIRTLRSAIDGGKG